LTEFYRSGSSIAELRRLHGQWWVLVRDQGDLVPVESECLLNHEGFLREVETTNMAKSFKAVLLESLLDNDGFRWPPRLEDFASQSLTVFRRRRGFVRDLRNDLRDLEGIDRAKWLAYWKGNPINAWIGGNKSGSAKNWFIVRDDRFQTSFDLSEAEVDIFQSMVHEQRQDAGGDAQYLLRLVTKTSDGRYVLKATNPDYPDYEADESMRTLARLRTVLHPEELDLTDDGEIG
jgi:hypothetical protein